MNAQRLLERAECLIGDLKSLGEDEQEVVNEYIGEFINIDVATERLLKLKDKQNHE